MNLSDKTTKIIGWSMLAGGVILGGYAIYNHTKKDAKSTKNTKALAGTSSAKKHKKSKKSGAKKKVKCLGIY